MSTLEEELLESGAIKKQRKVVFRKDRHLATAIITSEIQYMLANKDNPAALKREHTMLLEDIGQKEILHPRHLYSWFMNNKNLLTTTNNATELNNILNTARLATEISVEDYTGVKTSCLHPVDEFLTQVHHIKDNFDDVFDAITFDVEFTRDWNIGKVSGCAYGNLHVINVDKTSVFVVTHAHLAGIRDMFNSWFDILVYSSSNRNKYEGHDLYEHTKTLIDLMTKFSKDHNEHMASLLKSWPSLAIASILRDTELDPTFFNSLAEDAADYINTDLFRFITRYVWTDADVHLALESSGLWKCFGHPVIDMDESVKAWVKKGTVLKEDLDKPAEDLAQMFALTFCRNYFKEKRCWPGVDYDHRTSDRIVRNINSGTWEEDGKYPWTSEDFKGVSFKKTLLFDMHVDITDLLHDKSIIPERDQWIYEFDRQVHRTLYNRFPNGPPATTKSAVIAFLETESIDVEDIIRTIEGGYIPEEWKVIVAVAKEREQKEKNARFYAKMTFAMRLYQTATESNIADHVFPYIPQQTMTMGEEKLLRTILRMTSPKLEAHSPEYRYLVIDFSSWCTNFRYELAVKIFKMLDDLFGLKGVYQFTHLFPLMCILLFQDRFCPPEQDPETGLPKEGPRCVHGPEAWQEGLRQKGWTIITIALISLVAEICGTTASLIGQGDNQVILLRIPSPKVLRNLGMTTDQYVNWFVDELVRMSNLCGLPIKGEETWRSRFLFEYSREYYYKGAHVCSALKRASRLSSESNQTLPTTTGDLSSLYSTGAATAAKDTHPGPAYFCTSVEAAYLLRRKLKWLKEMPVECTVACLLVSRYLGGLPIGLYASFCTRAIQDPLTVSLHLVKTACLYPAIRMHLHHWLSLTMGSPDWETLIKDPQCLPLRRPLQAESIVRKEVKNGITTVVRNTMMKELFNSDTEIQKADLISTLMSIQPVNPRLLNKLYSLSNLSIQEKYLGKFSNTRSIQRLAFQMWADESELLIWMKTTEETTFTRHKLQKGSDSDLCRIESAECTTRLAYDLRREGWGVPLEGVTMPAQQEQSTIHPWSSVPPAWKPYSILIQVDSTMDGLTPMSKGKRHPYFGSQTQLRARRAPLQVLEVGSMISNLKQLIEIRQWLHESPELTPLIDKLIEEKTTMTPDQLDRYTRQVYSGTLSHRMDCPGMRRGGLANQTTTFASHVVIISDTATQYAKKGDNHTICFQSVFLTAMSQLSQLAYAGVEVIGPWAAVLSCTQCTNLIEKETFTMNVNTYPGTPLPISIQTLTPKIIPLRIANVMGYTTDLVLSYTINMARKFVVWEIGLSHTDRITSLTNRDAEDEHMLSQFNLTEFQHINCHIFLMSVVFYYFLFEERIRKEPTLITEKVLLYSASKGPFDVLLDTMTKSGLLKDLAALSGGRLTGLSAKSHVVLRSLLVDCINSILELGVDKIVSDSAYLTPEDTTSAYYRATCLILSAAGHVDHPPLDLEDSPELLKEWLVKEHGPNHAAHFTPVMVAPEDVAINHVRTLKRKPSEPLGARTAYPPYTTLRTRDYTSHPLYTNPTTLPHNLYLLSRLLHIIKVDLPNNPSIVTINDPTGEAYAMAYHSLQPIKDTGLPIWQESDPASVLSRGPLSCTTDKCQIPWNYTEWLSGLYELAGSYAADLIIVLPTSHSPVTCMLKASVIIQETIFSSGLSKDALISFADDTSSTRCWAVTGSSRLRGNIHIGPLHIGPRQALAAMAELHRGITACENITSWVSTQLRLRVRNRSDFLLGINNQLVKDKLLYKRVMTNVDVVGPRETMAVLSDRSAKEREGKHHALKCCGWTMLRHFFLHHEERETEWIQSVVLHTHKDDRQYLCPRTKCRRPQRRIYHRGWNETPQYNQELLWKKAVYLVHRLTE